MNVHISPATKILAIGFKVQSADEAWREAVLGGDLIRAVRIQRAINEMEAEIESLRTAVR